MVKKRITFNLFMKLIFYTLILSLSPYIVFAACAPQPNGLISFWPADNNANDIADNNPGTIQDTNLVTYGTGKVGQAWKFTGGISYNSQVKVAHNENIEPRTAITITAWIKNTMSTLLNYGGIVDKATSSKNSYALYIDSDKSIYFVVNYNNPSGQACKASNALNTDLWQHIAAAYDSTIATDNVKIYVNGQVVKTCTITGQINPVTGDLLIGYSLTAPTPYGGYAPNFDGKIDELAIFNRALSLSDIQSLFNAGSDGMCNTGSNIQQVICNSNSIIGDVNNDGTVNFTDANLTLKVATGMISQPSNLCCIDVAPLGNPNNAVDLGDSVVILRMANGTVGLPNYCGRCDGGIPNEICSNSIDDNCNGNVDESGCSTCTDNDHDGDGYGVLQCIYNTIDCGCRATAKDIQCGDKWVFGDRNVQARVDCPEGYIAIDGRCWQSSSWDAGKNTHFTINETGQNYQRCEGVGDGSGGSTCHGFAITAEVTCTDPSSVSQDCNDNDAAVNPGAAEVCDSIDNNCNNQVDEGDACASCIDNDGDEYGTGCTLGNDCNDTDPDINPQSTEVCSDLVDNDCDSEVDETDCGNAPAQNGSCYISNRCAQASDCVLSFYDRGHAALCSSYISKLCCPGNGQGNIKSPFIKLSDVTNAHVEQINYRNYRNTVEFSTNVQIKCNYSQNCQDSVAILSISSRTNAHIGRPNTYPLKVCCNLTQPGGIGCRIFQNPSAQEQIGNIVYLDCEGFEYVSDGTQWQKCNNVFPNNNNIITITKNSESHEYLCNGAGNTSIFECVGDNAATTFSYSAGAVKSTGDSVRTSSGTYYCLANSRWSKNLDGTDENTCTKEGEGRYWTGTKCCSEEEDQAEYYNDIIGGCWNEIVVWNNTYVTNDTQPLFKEVINFGGRFYGCSISANNYKPNNNNLLSIKDTHTNQQLITDESYCAIHGGRFCSFTEEWKPYLGEQRDKLSEAPWQPQQRAECCGQSQCWNGSNCINPMTQSSLPYPNPGASEGYRCIDGQWAFLTKKRDWNGNKEGWCNRNDMCLVNPDGNQENNDNTMEYHYELGDDPSHSGNPVCISNGRYILDHYCENGNWTSRTKLIALQLLKVAEAESSDNYVLYCNDFDKTLNYLDYSYINPIRSYLTNNCFINGNQVPCANKFCVLNYKDEVIFGTSLNQPINSSEFSFLYAVGRSDITSCNLVTSIYDGQFHSCDGSDIGKSDMWYNSRLQSAVYAKKGVHLGQVSFWEAFLNFLKNPFQSIIDFITNIWKPKYPGLGIEMNLEFIKKTKDFNRIYIGRNSNKLIQGIIEKVAGSEYLTINLKGFTADICQSIKLFNEREPNYDLRKGKNEIACAKNNNDYTVVSRRPATGSWIAEQAWPELTAKARLS